MGMDLYQSCDWYRAACRIENTEFGVDTYGARLKDMRHMKDIVLGTNISFLVET